jgi:hypothetical protein
MMSRYLFASFFGALIGAGCVLIAVHVTNANALVVTTADINDAVSSLHTRINDFYVFAGIVITLLLTINLAVYIKADGEVEKHINEKFGFYEKNLKDMVNTARKIVDEMEEQNSKLKDDGDASYDNQQ